MGGVGAAGATEVAGAAGGTARHVALISRNNCHMLEQPLACLVVW